MKSLSTMSITAEMEKEDKIRELENVVDDQRAVIQNQSQRIHELEVVVQEIGNNNNVHNVNGGVYKNGTDDNDEYANEEIETNGYYDDEH